MKYKYLVIEDSKKLSVEQEELDILGQEGWELVAVVDLGHALRLYFKRPEKEILSNVVD